MKVERTHGPENKIIYCNVPPMLPGQLLNSPPALELEQHINGQYGQFSLTEFMARYMAGNRSIREARKVSRKRLALVNSDVGYMDPEAYELHSQIQGYIKASKLLGSAPQLTSDLVQKANGYLAREHKSSGKLRQIQNWIGSKDPFTAAYVCPPADMLDSLFDNWLEFSNNDECSPVHHAIIAHCQLASIHPFIEGNGRLARVVLESILRKAIGEHIPLLLYRLSPICHFKSYVQMQELFNVGDEKGLSDPFWQKAVAWNNHLQPMIKAILDKTKKQLSGKIGLCMLTPASVKLIDHLWSQPIVSAKSLLKLFDQDHNQVQQALTQLTQLGIIEARLLKEPKDTVIYDCPIIFAAYHEMDEAVFACR